MHAPKVQLWNGKMPLVNGRYGQWDPPAVPLDPREGRLEDPIARLGRAYDEDDIQIFSFSLSMER
jgi:hypothetical protein